MAASRNGRTKTSSMKQRFGWIALLSCLYLAIRNESTRIEGEPESAAATSSSCSPQHACNDGSASGPYELSVVTTAPPSKDCDHSIALRLQRLDAFKHDDLTMVELLGPTRTMDAAGLVITVSHGGSLKPDFIPDRTKQNDNYCPPGKGCSVVKDVQTIELALKLAERFATNYCRLPYVVVNHLHRSKMDANRDIDEATFGNQIAQDAWLTYHGFVQSAQARLEEQMKTVVNTKKQVGVRGLLLDLHGYGGLDWNAQHGGPFIQWGYGMSTTDFEQCPIQTAGSLVHAGYLATQSHECLIRGQASLGQRVMAHLVDDSRLARNADEKATCGTGLPSADHPIPRVVKSDPRHCESSSPPCHYYRGGFGIARHQFMNWTTKTPESDVVTHFNSVQAELPRCIRQQDENVQQEFADSFSVALCSFLRDVFPASARQVALC